MWLVGWLIRQALPGLKESCLSVLSLVFPEPTGCAFCGGRQQESLVCAACASECLLKPHDLCRRCCYPSRGPLDLCRSCWQDPPPFNRAVAAGVYVGPLRNAIVRLKYFGEKARAQPLGRVLANQVACSLQPPDLIVPVPLHPQRLAVRGYNQAGILARVIGKEFALPVREDVLLRHRSTGPQASLGYSARQSNVKGAFTVAKAWCIVGKAVLLIDDVYTTGATARACTEALLHAGARRVDIAVLAVDI